MQIQASKFLEKTKVIRCRVDYDGAAIAKYVTDVYKAFANDDIADALGKVLSAALNALFGNAVANSSEDTR